RAPAARRQRADLRRDAPRSRDAGPGPHAGAARGLVLLRAPRARLRARDRRGHADDRGDGHRRGGIAAAQRAAPFARAALRAHEPQRGRRDRGVRPFDLPGRPLPARHRAVATAGLETCRPGRERTPLNNGLVTEAHRPELADLDIRGTRELVALMNETDAGVAAAGA